jgi:allantoin racemase
MEGGNGMKIRVVIPNSSSEFTATQVSARKKAAFPGTEVDVVCLPHGPVSIEYAWDEALAAPYILEVAKKTEAEGFDAVTVDCAMDPALRAVREQVSIPVASGGESSFLVAMALGTKFSVVTVLESTAKVIRENLQKYGFTSRVASVRFANVPVLDLVDEEKAAQAILAEAKKAIAEDGAEVIVLGCTGMSPLARKLRQELGVPVVDPAAASIKLAEALAAMGLAHSKAAYLTPPAKEIR